LLFDQARFERAAGDPSYSQHLEQAVSLAQRHCIVDVLVGASLLVSGPPGTVTYANARQILEAALEALPDTERANRAMLLSHLSWHPPYNWDRQRVQALLEEARNLAAHTGNAGLRTVLRAQLFYSAGPGDHSRALAVADQMRDLVAVRAARQRARWALEPELTRVLMLLQRGDMLGAQRALDAFGTAARELRHVELMWHHERLAVIMRMNSGEFAYVRERLLELHQRANLLELHGRKPMELVDWSQWYRHTTSRAPTTGVGPEMLRPARTDGPLAYAVKLRLLVQFGWREEAKLELDALSPDTIAKIPSSRDYIALLGHFAYAATATRSAPHASLLYELLSPYPHLCQVALAMHCDGVVSRTLGGLAQILGKRSQAIQHYELALLDSERYGLLPQLAETRHEYAQLLSTGQAHERQHARDLATEARDLAQQLGMKPLTQDCERFLAGGVTQTTVVVPATTGSS
jgi:tetratricopeptide (TPR) repeat protein